MKSKAYFQLQELEDQHWWFVGMRQITLCLLGKVDKKGAVLDAGCGTGGNSKMLSQFGWLVNLDISKLSLSFAKRKVNFPLLQGDVQQLPFKSQSFTLVTSFDVLYHFWVKNLKEAIKEHVRILKPNGWLLLRLPTYQWLYRHHDQEVMTARRFTLRSLRKELPPSVKIVKATYANMFLFPLVIASKMTNNTDLKPLPYIFNWICKLVLLTESWLIRYTSLPFGSSLFVLIQKKEKRESL